VNVLPLARKVVEVTVDVGIGLADLVDVVEADTKTWLDDKEELVDTLEPFGLEELVEKEDGEDDNDDKDVVVNICLSVVELVVELSKEDAVLLWVVPTELWIVDMVLDLVLELGPELVTPNRDSRDDLELGETVGNEKEDNGVEEDMGNGVEEKESSGVEGEEDNGVEEEEDWDGEKYGDEEEDGDEEEKGKDNSKVDGKDNDIDKENDEDLEETIEVKKVEGVDNACNEEEEEEDVLDSDWVIVGLDGGFNEGEDDLADCDDNVTDNEKVVESNRAVIELDSCVEGEEGEEVSTDEANSARVEDEVELVASVLKDVDWLEVDTCEALCDEKSVVDDKDSNCRVKTLPSFTVGDVSEAVELVSIEDFVLLVVCADVNIEVLDKEFWLNFELSDEADDPNCEEIIIVSDVDVKIWVDMELDTDKTWTVNVWDKFPPVVFAGSRLEAKLSWAVELNIVVISVLGVGNEVVISIADVEDFIDVGLDKSVLNVCNELVDSTTDEKVIVVDGLNDVAVGGISDNLEKLVVIPREDVVKTLSVIEDSSNDKDGEMLT
jgi:hypothetical protein